MQHLPQQPQARVSRSYGLLANNVPGIACGAVYMTISVGLIYMNKFILEDDRFPFAVPLVMMHTSFGVIITSMVYLVAPHLFTSLTHPQDKIEITSRFMLTSVFPIAACFAVQLVASNAAYIFATVPFLQMVKESNVVVGFFIAVLFAVETFSLNKVSVLLIVIVATTMTIRGQVDMSWVGLLLQGSSVFVECTRLVLLNILLAGKKFDSLSYMLVVMPLCFMCLLATCLPLGVGLNGSLGGAPHEDSLGKVFALPALSAILDLKWLLLANVCLAYALNIVTAIYIKNYASVVAFILTGIVKDVVIVSFGVLCMGLPTSKMQVVGFLLQICGVLCWSMLKTFPDAFQDGLLTGVIRVMTSDMSQKGDLSKDVKSYGAADVEKSAPDTEASKA